MADQLVNLYGIHALDFPTGVTSVAIANGTVTINLVNVSTASVALTGQSAAIGSTTLFTPSASAKYSLAYYLKVTTAAGASSSAVLTIGWTDSTDSQNMSVVIPTPANAVDSTGLISGAVVMDVKQSTNITYSVAYASTPAGMQYKLNLNLEAL